MDLSERDVALTAIWTALNRPVTEGHRFVTLTLTRTELRKARAALDHLQGAVDPSEVDRLANDLAGDWRERAEKAEAEVTVWKTRLVEETARLRALLAAERGAVGGA